MSEGLFPNCLPELVARHPRLLPGKHPPEGTLLDGWVAAADKLCADLKTLAEPLVRPGCRLPLRVEVVSERDGGLDLFAKALLRGQAGEDLAEKAGTLTWAACLDTRRFCPCRGADSSKRRSPWPNVCPAYKGLEDQAEGRAAG